MQVSRSTSKSFWLYCRGALVYYKDLQFNTSDYAKVEYAETDKPVKYRCLSVGLIMCLNF